jgi:GTPase SAR1 family protein
LIGLDGAGKTTIIYNLKNGQAIEGTSTVPSIGFTI